MSQSRPADCLQDLLSNSLTHLMNYGLFLLSRNWQADLLAEWFRADLLTFIGLATSTVWGLTSSLTDWMSQSRLADFPRTCQLINCLAGRLLKWLPLLSGGWQADLQTEWFRADLLTFLGLASWFIDSLNGLSPGYLYCLGADKLTYWLNDLLMT